MVLLVRLRIKDLYYLYLLSKRTGANIIVVDRESEKEREKEKEGERERDVEREKIRGQL